MKTCPPLAEWEQLRSRALDPSTTRFLKAHLAECRDCATIYEQVEHHAHLMAKIRENYSASATLIVIP